LSISKFANGSPSLLKAPLKALDLDALMTSAFAAARHISEENAELNDSSRAIAFL
jgi:hypothetical protein